MRVTLQANESSALSLAGYGFSLSEAAQPVKVKLFGGDGVVDEYLCQAGDSIFDPDERFNSIELINGATPQTIEIQVNRRRFISSRLAGAVDATIKLPAAWNPLAEVAGIDEANGQLILAANASREGGVLITASESNAVDLYLVDSTGANIGYILVPGQSMVVETIAAIYGKSSSNTVLCACRVVES